MPQRITVPMSEVTRIKVPMSEIQRGGEGRASAQTPYSSPVDPRSPTSATASGPISAAIQEFGRAASERSADVMRGLGLERPLTWLGGMIKSELEPHQHGFNIPDIQLPSVPSSPLNYGPIMLFADPEPTKQMIAAPVRSTIEGIKGGVEAGATSARGFASLTAPTIPAPTEQEFKSAAEGAGKFLPVAIAAQGIPKAASTLRGRFSDYRNAVADAVTPVQRDAALGQIAASGIREKGVSPYRIGSESRQGLQQAFHEFGLDPERLPSSNRSPLVNELVLGGTDADLARVNQLLEAEHAADVAAGRLPATAQFTPVESIQLAVADRAVEIYHRPIQNAVDTFAQVKRPEVKRAVYHDMKKLAAENTVPNPALATAFENAARQIAGVDDTVSSINALKVKANKMPSPGFTGGPSQQIAAEVSVAEAQQRLASSIRRHLYPALEQIGKINGKPMNGELLKAGKREVNAIAFRDGAYNSWSRAALGQTTADLDNWWHHTIRGHSESVPFLGTPFKRPAVANMIGRAMTGTEKPMREFNELFRKGTGSLRGFIPETAIVTPRMEITSVSEVQPPSPPPYRQNTWGEIPPPGPLSRVGGVELSPERMLRGTTDPTPDVPLTTGGVMMTRDGRMISVPAQTESAAPSIPEPNPRRLTERERLDTYTTGGKRPRPKKPKQ